MLHMIKDPNLTPVAKQNKQKLNGWSGRIDADSNVLILITRSHILQQYQMTHCF